MIMQYLLGRTNVAQHVIHTGDTTPVKLPPCPIPFLYSERVQSLLKDMIEVRLSNSPWCTPAVYIPKSNGEIRMIMCGLCIIKQDHKRDSYPVLKQDLRKS